MQYLTDQAVTKHFQCTQIGFANTFDEWLENIGKELGENRPILISTKVGNGAHIKSRTFI